MTAQTSATLKGYFNTGDVPTEAQFANLIDSTVDVVNVIAYGAAGDGVTDDTAEIAAAITAAGSGGAVYFPPGTYLVSSALVPLQNQRLFGQHSRKSILKADATMSQTTNTSRFFRLDNDGVTIERLGFQGHANVQCPIYCSADDCTVQFCWMDDASQRGVQCELGARMHILDNIFDGTAGPAHVIELTKSTYCDVSRNRILSSAADGVEVPPYTDLTIGNRIIDNYIANCVNGIQLMGDIESVVIGNTIEDCSQYGIYCWRGEYPDTQYSMYDTIADNVIRNCGGTTITGFFVSYSVGHQITGNVVEGSGSIGIHVDYTSSNCNVANNTCRKNRSHGLVITAPGCVASGNICIDNGEGFSDARSGLVIEANGTVVTNNVCTDTRASASKNQQFGLLISSASGILLYGNVLGGNKDGNFWDSTGGINTGLQAGTDGAAIVKKHLTGSALWTPSTIAAGAIAWTQFSLVGARPADTLTCGFTSCSYVGVLPIPTCLADDQVTLTLHNLTGVEITLGAGTARVDVWQH